jgi:tetratricopeptide (TPR) repeat protein
MIDKRVTARLPRPQPVRVGALLVVVILLCAAGCSKKGKALSEIKSEFARGDCEETVALCQRALRDQVSDAELFYYYGLALLTLERDDEAVEQLGKAVSMNGTLSERISEDLVAKAGESVARGKTPQAAQRLRNAARFQADIEVGPLGYLLAESFFGDKQWREAAHYYETALGEYPDTSAAEGGYYNLASCFAALVDSAAAIRTLETELARFPNGALAGQAEWSLSTLLYAEARSEFGRGDYDGAVESAVRIIDRTDDVAAVQRARFLIGEAYERKGDYAAAYEQYQTIIGGDAGVSGRWVERARAKIKAMRDAGLR